MVAFGLYMPLIGALIGLFASHAIGLSLGGMTLVAVLAASGDLAAWGGAAGELLAAADAAAERAASHAHIATEEGEVYAVRWGGIAMVAVSERFALASLMLNDMRATLRGLAATAGAG